MTETTETLSITTEQINDLPFLLGLVNDMGIGQAIDAQIQPHGGWQGISVGTAVSLWLCHIVMERDHRLVSVRDWAAARQRTLADLLGEPLRETDLTDDRLANVLTMLSDPADQAAIDQALLGDWLRVYQLPRERVRLDSTSVSVYHDDPPADGLLHPGHSKDHRPDLAQFKAMLASLDPLGLPLACQVVPGNAADDGLYVPAYDAAVRTLGTADVLIVGDSKMGALATRGHIVRGPRPRSRAGLRTPWPIRNAGKTCGRWTSRPGRSRRWRCSTSGHGRSKRGTPRGPNACWWCARRSCRRGCGATGRRP